MIRGVADTHTAIWYLFGDARLSTKAKAVFDLASAEGDNIGLSSITLVEVVYLVEKHRIRPEAFNRLVEALDTQNNVLVEIPLNRVIVEAMFNISRAVVPEMPDR